MEKISNFPLPASISSALLYHDELRAHAFLGTSSDDDKIDGWNLDIGAMHHMIGWCKFSFVRGSVKFGVASTIEIMGIGWVIFKAKPGEH